MKLLVYERQTNYKSMPTVETNMGTYRFSGDINELHVGNYYDFAVFKFENIIVLTKN